MGDLEKILGAKEKIAKEFTKGLAKGITTFIIKAPFMLMKFVGKTLWFVAMELLPRPVLTFIAVAFLVLFFYGVYVFLEYDGFQMILKETLRKIK
ncbi:hypothetical protein DET54_10516 [Paenibacillus pabuli]|uniref:Uncharacterized protein n=1 Tax=Paenibacillus pabuli TaxID=1472 RepID=A0ABX9BKR4_9BACL|nr:hypothetical protein [Paenibacillus pabuli]RAI97057.1 hypothetical protein DET54_10516 [Paenibacillus pabuli]